MDNLGIENLGIGSRDVESRIRGAFEALMNAFGPQEWWPGDSAFEVMVGAVLTQNTAWKNVEHALLAVDEAGALSPGAMAALDIHKLERLVRPAGSFRRKAGTLSALAAAVCRSPAGLESFLAAEPSVLRLELLSIPGIGPETADSILLYAAGYPRFVVDAYARRFLVRHGLAAEREPYDRIQALFETALGRDTGVLGECHALLVELGKRYCRPSARCTECPLTYDLEVS